MLSMAATSGAGSLTVTGSVVVIGQILRMRRGCACVSVDDDPGIRGRAPGPAARQWAKQPIGLADQENPDMKQSFKPLTAAFAAAAVALAAGCGQGFTRKVGSGPERIANGERCIEDFVQHWEDSPPQEHHACDGDRVGGAILRVDTEPGVAVTRADGKHWLEIVLAAPREQTGETP